MVNWSCEPRGTTDCQKPEPAGRLMGWAFYPRSCRFLHFLRTTTHNTTPRTYHRSASSQAMISTLCDRSLHPLFSVATQSGRWHFGVKLSENCFSFSQVSVHPHCPLTNYFWFAHFTISDLQLDCSAKMALCIVHWNKSQNITKRNTGIDLDEHGPLIARPVWM